MTHFSDFALVLRRGRREMPYMWDSIPAYRLQKAVVIAFLIRLFGYVEFYTQVSKDMHGGKGRMQTLMA